MPQPGGTMQKGRNRCAHCSFQLMRDALAPAGGVVVAVDGETRKRVDQWIRENDRNEFGDPKGTMYAGGTPLFDMRTGQTRDRYEYILDKHPELRGK